MQSILTVNGLPRGRFHFSVTRVIGAGGFGIVDEIVITASNCDLPVGARYARKRLNEKFNSHAEARTRFEREIAQVRAMADLPGIVNYQGENLPGGERFYVMDLFPSNLRRYIAGAGARPWREVAGFCAALADTMAQAHARGFIHRDLKPENILLTEDLAHVIADWGLGYFMHQESKVLVALTRGGMGSEYYCSLEQWATGKCGENGDVYSLGMMAAELATGAQSALPYQGAGITTAVVDEREPGAARFNHVLRAMTAVLASNRVATMDGAAGALRACLR